MNANIEALVAKHFNPYAIYGTEHLDHMRNALTEQAEAFNGELQAYDGMVRELTKTVEDMRAAQSVPVVGEPVAFEAGFEWARMLTGHVHDGRDVCRTLTAYFWPAELRGIEVDGMATKEQAVVQAKAEIMRRLSKPTNSITAAELATLREKAAEADELQKRAERMQKALSDIAEWTDRYTTPGHPVSTIASAAIAQGKVE